MSSSVERAALANIDKASAKNKKHFVDRKRGGLTASAINEVIPKKTVEVIIQELKKDGWNVISIHITRPNFENSLTEEQRMHPSEIALDGYRFNHEVINDGTPEGMKNQINNLIAKIV